MIPDRVLAAKARGREAFRRWSVGIGVGRKQYRPHLWCIRVYVLSTRGAASEQPPEMLGVPTEIIEAGTFRPLAGQAAPVKSRAGPGSSIGYSIEASNLSPTVAGTLGAVLADEAGDWYILGNNHILAVN